MTERKTEDGPGKEPGPQCHMGEGCILSIPPKGKYWKFTPHNNSVGRWGLLGAV